MAVDAPVCIHNVLEGNINEFVFMEPSRRAIDELFSILEHIQEEAMKNNPTDLSNPALADVTCGFPPLNYAFLRLQPMITKYPLMRQARVAMIAHPSPLLKTVSVVMRSVTPVRFYNPSQRDLALAWLRGPSA
jgi:hypothetical protein